MNNYDLLTDNQKAFVKSIANSAGVPEEATIEYLLSSDDDNFYENSIYCEWYSLLADCHGVWRDAIQFSKNQKLASEITLIKG
jgi:hypothetical protein